MRQQQYKFISNAMPAYYILMRLQENEIDIYQSIHRLLSEQIVERVYSSICPICGSENITKQEYTSVNCCYCDENYFSENVEEKFKLL